MRPKFPDGFRAWCVVVVLFFGTIAHGAEQHPLMGATREEVLARYGEPRSTLVAGSREFLFYQRERLVLREGVVVEVERIAEQVRRPTPAPATTTAESSASASAAPGEPPAATVKTAAPAEAAPSKAPARAEASTGTSAPASTPSSVETAPPPPPPEPKLEIKRVLPRGTTSGAATPKQPSAVKAAPLTAPTATPAPTARSSSAAAGAETPAGARATAVEPSSGAPSAPVSTTSSVPAAPAAAAAADAAPALPGDRSAATESPALASTTPSPAASETAETRPSDTVMALKAKEEAKKAAEARAARRRMEQAAADAADPTASLFTGRTYLIGLLVIGGGIGYLIWRSRQRQLVLAATSVSRTPFQAPVTASSGALFTADVIAKLEWKRFEELVALYYNKTGVVATRTKNGPAAPVNIKISWKGEPRPFALVQCIAQPQALVDAKAVQELFNVLTAEDIRRGYVVTTGKFNVAARDLAEEKHITLLPGDIFLEKLNALPDPARAELMQQITAGDYTTPSCPKCEAKMMRAPDDPAVFRCMLHPDQEIPAGR